MKEVFLIRHAKSSWGDMTLADDKRPLNSRGLRDAPLMAELLASKYPSMDLIISSHAKRARLTAQYFAKAYFKKKKDIVIKPELYMCYIEDVQTVIQSVSDQHKRIAVFGHNPTWTSFVNLLPNVSIDNVPTCGIAVIKSDIDHWADFMPHRAQLSEFLYPKLNLT